MMDAAAPIFGDSRLPARFWAKVRLGSVPIHRPDLGPCWEWMACRTRSGYGHFHVGSRTDGSMRQVRPHRLAYETLIGPIPEGLQSDHLCRNRPCIRPNHIEPVTGSVNCLRSPLMGRRGEAHGAAKLRAAQIPIIRALRGKVRQVDLGRWYGVSQVLVSRIQRGGCWTHV